MPSFVGTMMMKNTVSRLLTVTSIPLPAAMNQSSRYPLHLQTKALRTRHSPNSLFKRNIFVWSSRFSSLYSVSPHPSILYITLYTNYHVVGPICQHFTFSSLLWRSHFAAAAALADAGPLRSARAHPTGGALALADAAVRRTRVQLGARTREQASGHEDPAAAAWRRQPSRRRRTALSARGHPRRVPAPGAARVGQAAAFVQHAAGIWLVFVV